MDQPKSLIVFLGRIGAVQGIRRRELSGRHFLSHRPRQRRSECPRRMARKWRAGSLGAISHFRDRWSFALALARSDIQISDTSRKFGMDVHEFLMRKLALSGQDRYLAWQGVMTNDGA